MANAKESLRKLKLSKANIFSKEHKTYSSMMGMFFFILGTLHIIIK